jgi:hypothetical protein
VIPTNIWSNVIVSPEPASQVNALPETMEDSIFTISWEGTAGDMSSGLLGYDVYVSRDDGPYARLLEKTMDTEAVFTGNKGASYSFYSILTTLDGVVETAPSVADAVTSILADTSHTDTTNNDTTQVNVVQELVNTNGGFDAAVYPVPAADQLFVEYSTAEPVELRLIDLNGRMLYESRLEPSIEQAKIELDISPYESGIMILRLSSSDSEKNYRIVKL